jgi:transcriptional regulator with XRE-family HTH domain
MSGIERGVRNTSVLKLAAIAHALGVPTASLFSRDRHVP